MKTKTINSEMKGKTLVVILQEKRVKRVYEQLRELDNPDGQIPDTHKLPPPRTLRGFRTAVAAGVSLVPPGQTRAVPPQILATSSASWKRPCKVHANYPLNCLDASGTPHGLDIFLRSILIMNFVMFIRLFRVSVHIG